MKDPSQIGKDSEAGMASGVRGACRHLLEEARRFAWQFLGVGSGLWLEAALCTERFVVDLAEALERRLKPESALARRWDGRVVNDLLGRRLVHTVRRGEPGATAWRRLAMRIDTAVVQKGYDRMLLWEDMSNKRP